LTPGLAVKEILPHWYGAQFGLAAIDAIGRPLFLAHSAELARRVPIRRLIRPKTFNAIPEVVRLLRGDLTRLAAAAPAPVLAEAQS
jgi:hypothetical protein